MEEGSKSYRPISPVQKLQLQFRWFVMWIFGPATILVGLWRLLCTWGWF